MDAACRLYLQAVQRTPEDDRTLRSQIYYRLGECRWSQGQPNDAFDAFQQAVDADGSNAGARLRLGEILLAGGALDLAHEQAISALQSGRGDPEVLALLGAASSGVGQDQLAIMAFTKVLQAEPGRVNVAVALADVYLRQGRVQDARSVLKGAAAAQVGSAMPLLALGRLEEQEGNLAAAEQAYRQAAAREDTPHTNLRLAQFLEQGLRVEEAKVILRRVDAMQPLSPTALPDFELLAGRADQALPRYFDAMRSGALQAARRKKEESPLGEGRAALASRIIEADLEMVPGSEDREQAIAAARLHLDQYRGELDPGTFATLQAEVALAAGDVPLAESQGQSAVERAPQSSASQYVYGLAKYRAGDNVEARRAWLHALDLDDSSVPVRLALARDSLHRGALENAEAYVLPVLHDEPGDWAALELYAQLLLGQHRFSDAQLIAERCAAMDPEAAFPQLLLGRIAEVQQHDAEALLRFDRALGLDPHSQAAMEGLIRIYRRRKIGVRTLAKMEDAAAQSNSPSLMELTGRLYAELGFRADAERCLQKTLGMDGQRASAATTLAGIFAQRGDLKAVRRSVAGLPGATAALVSAVAAQGENNLDAAIADYEAAVRHGEPSGVAANNLAWLYAERGTHLDRALALAEQARSLCPENPAILDTLGFVHLRRHEYTNAMQVLQDAAELAALPASQQPDVVRAIREHLQEACLRAGLTVDPGGKAPASRFSASHELPGDRRAKIERANEGNKPKPSAP
jgi:tetratricopeptide (TPR) repeat protein